MIRFVPDAIPVNVTAVPDVLATSVQRVIPDAGASHAPSPLRKFPEPGVPVASSIPKATLVCDIYSISYGLDGHVIVCNTVVLLSVAGKSRKAWR